MAHHHHKSLRRRAARVTRTVLRALVGSRRASGARGRFSVATGGSLRTGERVFERDWHRATWPGRQIWIYRAIAVGLGLLVLYSIFYTLGLAPERRVIAYSAVYWLILAWFVLLTWRCLPLGLYAGEGGIRIVWLSRQRVGPWKDVDSSQLSASPASFGGRMYRVVRLTRSGERIPLQGTDDMMRWFFKANSPEKVRHRLERERRFYLGKHLPRRSQPPSRRSGG